MVPMGVPMGSAWRTSRHRRIGIRARLLGLVMIPLIGFLAVGAEQLLDHRRVADHAYELVAGVDEATAALDALVTLTGEFRLAEILVQARAFGLDPFAVGDLVGYDVARDLAAARAAVDADALVGELLASDGGWPALVRERAAVDRGGDQDLMRELVAAAQGRWMAATATEPSAGGDDAVDAALRRSLEVLGPSARLFEAAGDRMLILADQMVPGLADGLVAVTDPIAVQARYDVALEQVLETAHGDVLPAAQRVRDSREFEAALARIGPVADPTADLDRLAGAFRLGLEHDQLVQALVTTATADARARAVAAGRAANDAYDRTMVALLALLGATVVAALGVAASISRPLRRLAARAADVSDGELAGPPLPLEGPPETAMVAAALNDAVDNLRVVEERMGALAAGDLEVAQRRAPGKLGELVGRSVDGLARSLSERDSLERRLAHEAGHDPLTGLANRRRAMASLEALVAGGRQVAVVFLDLDGFKAVNDEAGHAAGDQVLTVAAMRLSATTRDGSVVARFGGDEFFVAAAVGSEQEASVLARRIVDAFDDPLAIDAFPRRIAASVGVALSRPGEEPDALLRAADAALYEANRSGGGGVVLADASLRARLEDDHRLEIELRAAIVDGGLTLHYQPVFDAAGHLRGAEALVRWRRVDGTVVAPEKFVRIAERTGLVIELDRWVLGHGLAQLAQWRAGPLPRVALSVNVSSRTLLCRSLVAEVREALEATGVDAEALILEVTETALLHDLETAAAHIGRLRRLGVRISVDDFGTGYTSVSHLRILPVSEVKIDRSFVQAMGSDERDRALVELMARIGTVLHLDVVAEGVETQDQLVAVREAGCRFAQGFLLGRPMPPEELIAAHGGAHAGVTSPTARRGDR